MTRKASLADPAIGCRALLLWFFVYFPAVVLAALWVDAFVVSGLIGVGLGALVGLVSLLIRVMAVALLFAPFFVVFRMWSTVQKAKAVNYEKEALERAMRWEEVPEPHAEEQGGTPHGPVDARVEDRRDPGRHRLLDNAVILSTRGLHAGQDEAEAAHADGEFDEGRAPGRLGGEPGPLWESYDEDWGISYSDYEESQTTQD